MRSSTSVSESSAGASLAVWALLGAALCIGVLLEAGVRYVVPLVFANQRRMASEYQDALRLGHDPTGGGLPVLFLGNSLLLSDIDFEQAQALLGADFQARRWAIDDTNFLDWYFGLRRLFRHGARPGIVVLGAQPKHLIASHVRGGYFAHYLMDLPDFLEVADRLDLDATGTSELLFSHFSAYYGSREELNKRVLSWILPRFPALAGKLAGGPTAALPPDLVEQSAQRLDELNTLCRTYGARLVVWVPPNPRWLDRSDLVRAGNLAGVPVLVPGRDDRVEADRFSDGYHLDALGARHWTAILMPRLRPLLESERKGRPPREPGPAQPASRHF